MILLSSASLIKFSPEKLKHIKTVKQKIGSRYGADSTFFVFSEKNRWERNSWRIPKRIPDKDLNILTQLYFNNFLSLSQKYPLAVTIPYGLVFWGFFLFLFCTVSKITFYFLHFVTHRKGSFFLSTFFPLEQQMRL